MRATKDTLPARQLASRLRRRLLLHANSPPVALGADKSPRNVAKSSSSQPSPTLPYATPKDVRRYRQAVRRSRQQRLAAVRSQHVLSDEKEHTSWEDDDTVAARKASALIEDLIRSFVSEEQTTAVRTSLEARSQPRESQGLVAEHDRATDTSCQLRNQLQKLLALPHRSVKLACSSLPWDRLSEACCLTLVDDALKSDSTAPWNFEWLLEEAVLPLIRRLVHPPSRELTACILDAAERHSARVRIAIMIPLLSDRQLGLPQAELVNKIVKQSYSRGESTTAFKESFPLQPGLPQTRGVWSDAFIGVIKTLIDMSEFSIESDSSAADISRDSRDVTKSVEAFLLELESQVRLHPASNALGGLLHLLVRKHSEIIKQSRPCLEAARSVTALSTSFLQKGIARTLSNL